MADFTLHPGDCLDIMPTMEASSVDCILADIPYGTTACKWDTVIPFAPMWENIKRLIKPRGAVVLFGSQPFTSALVMSNPEWFKHAWVWDKLRGRGHLVCRHRPMQQTEDIVIFGKLGVNYNPQVTKRDEPRFLKEGTRTSIMGGKINEVTNGRWTDVRQPVNLLAFKSASSPIHPTQKPVDLMAYLIRTYTNPGETVLDFTMGSGSTGVAAIQEGRRFIGIEKDAGYFEIAQKRISEATRQPALLEVA
jgi:site-specific DNA-methyltransferase (adenine-specific)